MDKKLLEQIEDLDFTKPETKIIVLGLFETMIETTVELKNKVQLLEDEINRLKGEKGKPNIKPKNQKIINRMEKPEKKKHKKSSKKHKIKIDSEVIVKIDKTTLPEDVVFKGYATNVIQGIIIKSDNVLYKREQFYSAKEKKTYTAPLEEGLQGTCFSPELKAQIIKMYFEQRITENLICSLLNDVGIIISEGQVSNIIIKEKQTELTEEKVEIFEAGIGATESSHIDDTGIRVNGINEYVNIITSSLYAVFLINPNKKMDTIKTMFTERLLKLFKILVCDDAPQFKIAGIIIALCWVHEERHYEKLNPHIKAHRVELEKVIKEIWEFYKKLKHYKQFPSESFKNELKEEFEKIFKQEVNYPALSNRLKLTYAKKSELLVVLEHPDTELHNNISENRDKTNCCKKKNKWWSQSRRWQDSMGKPYVNFIYM